MTPTASTSLASRVAALSIAVALTLIAAKAYAWAASGSVSVLASLADSALDLAASVITFLSIRWAAAPPDAEHRFGHSKAEAVAGLIQTVLITGSALVVTSEGVGRLISPEPIARGGAAIAVMVFSIAMTGGLAAAQTYAIRRTGSLAVEADRAHYAGDLASNLAVLGALALSAYGGFQRVDALAGLAVAGFLVASASAVGRKAINQLMDRELPEATRARIVEIARSEPQVAGVHALRTRKAGRETFIQLHLELPPDMALAEAHAIADRVERALQSEFPKADVLIHQDPHGRWEDHDAYGRRPG